MFGILCNQKVKKSHWCLCWLVLKLMEKLMHFFYRSGLKIRLFRTNTVELTCIFHITRTERFWIFSVSNFFWIQQCIYVVMRLSAVAIYHLYGTLYGTVPIVHCSTGYRYRFRYSCTPNSSLISSWNFHKTLTGTLCMFYPIVSFSF
jgi:hypothetical protein